MQPDSRHPTLSILDKPFTLMGVVNTTPDSFYDGGRHEGTEAGVEHGVRLAEEGADILDVGGESTRPGAQSVSVEEECARVIPVIERLSGTVSVPISVDTTKAEVARRALDVGASWINDISAGRFDRSMPEVAAHCGCPVVLMHSRATPGTMQKKPAYENVVGEVEAELRAAVDMFVARGVRRENLILDPGIGFAKRLEDNLALLAGLEQLSAVGLPLLVGTSRKSFVGAITGREVDQRLYGTLGSVAAAFVKGCRFFRVHDVAATADMLSVLCRVLSR
jgi:dihydropteroate synthase